MLTLKLPQWAWILIFVGIAVLLFSLIRGCNQSNLQLSKFNKIDSLNNVLLNVVENDKLVADSTKKAFQDSLEFERGQRELIEAQKERTESELQDITKENKSLIAKYKLGKYVDTSSVMVPGEFVSDCQGCFVNLEKTTGLVEKYKGDISKLKDNWNKQDKIYQNRFKELDAEKLRFSNKIKSLVKEQKEAIDKLEPHGRLYLSWGVIWGPVPKYAGAGLMYQNKRNLLYGAKWYYGASGHMVETSINFPLSLRLK